MRMLRAVLLSILLAVSVTDAGVSYIRWGRTVCPTGSMVLYKGVMSGPLFNVGGSGANYMCLHEKPQFPKSVAGRQGVGMIFGVEFEMFDSLKSIFSTENIPGGVLHNQDIPCVRCYVEGSSDLMVVPARHDCGGSGYDLMYKGFLVSEAQTTRNRMEYVCLDEAPEGVAGGQGNIDQSLIYPVEIGCGSLPCNPFVDGLEAACAVCTY